MQIIPVLDLMSGHVVHARRGLRDHYAPIESSLVAGSDPFTIVYALVERFAPETIYVADLDAIQGTGSHSAVLTALARRWPQVTWWIDAGFANRAVVDAMLSEPNQRPVFGTESMSVHALHTIQSHDILSLDFRSGEPLGPRSAFENAGHWPRDVIVMELAKVGAESGPASQRTSWALKQSRDSRVFAAGGVRHAADLRVLSNMGVAGALIATALHNGAITANDISKLLAPPVHVP